MSLFWNERYQQKEYIYGTLPNVYLKQKLTDLTPGKILLPADGEGRNGVYAAKSGWESYCFDASEEGKNKAMKLARQNGMKLNYKVAKAEDINYPKNHFDAIALIYAHFGPDRKEIHQKLATYLKQGGVLILEAFNKEQLHNQKANRQSGGPKNVDMLYDLKELKEDFSDFNFLEAKNEQIQLEEGDHHRGVGNVVRIYALKK